MKTLSTFKNDLIVKQVILAFSLLIAMFIFLGSFSWIQINALEKLTVTTDKHPLEVSNASLRANLGLSEIHRDISTILSSNEQSVIDAACIHLGQEEDIILQQFDLIQDKIHGAEGQTLARLARNIFDDSHAIRAEVMRLARQGHVKQALTMVTKNRVARGHRLKQCLLTLTAYARLKADAFIAESQSIKQKIKLILLLTVATGLFLALLITFITVKKIKLTLYQRQQSENRLKISKAKFESFIKSASDGLMLFDSDFILNEVNDAALAVFPDGVKRTELLGKHILEINPTIKETGRYDKYREVIETGIPLLLEDVTPDLKFGKTLLRIKAFRVESGLGMIFTDITEQKNREILLQESEKRLKRAISVAPLPIMIHAENGEILQTSKAWNTISGYTKQEIPTIKDWLVRAYPEGRKKVIEVITAGYELDEARDHGNWPIRTSDGSKRIWHFRTVSLGKHADGRRLVMTMATDVTDRNEKERNIALAKTIAENANRAKSQFLANMSHEIRTPMNAILGMNRLVLETELTAEQEKYLQISRNASESLLNLLNDILDFSKIEAEQLILEEKAFSLPDVVYEAASTITIMAEKKGLEFICSIDADVPLNLIGDQLRLRQIFLNLLSNSVKFTEKGYVLMQIGMIHEDEKSVELYCKVIDTGSGISPKQQKHIFETFKQADSSVTRTHGGSGLGLTICRKLCEMMHGKIGCTSEPGKGTECFCTVTLRKAKQQQHPVTFSSEECRRPVLLTVKLPVCSNVIKQVLINAGLTVHTGLPDKTEARQIESAQQGSSYELLITDHSQPQTEKAAFPKLSTSLQQNAAIPVIGIMQLTETWQCDSCPQHDGYHCLSRPIIGHDLLRAVAQAFRGEPCNGSLLQPSIVALPLAPLPPQQILIVEDNKANQVLLEIILQRQGHQVLIASNGMDALQKILVHDFDFLFMDVQMPTMDGITATRVIRNCEKGLATEEGLEIELQDALDVRLRGRHVPIIAMTAHAYLEDRQRCLAAGMDVYLTKPFKEVEIHEVLGHLISGLDAAKFPGQQQLVKESLRQQSPNGEHNIKAKVTTHLQKEYQLSPQQIADMLQKAVQSIFTALDNAESALNKGQLQELSEAAHTAKGAIALLGLKNEAELAGKIEVTARVGEQGEFSVWLADLRTILNPLKK